MLWGSLVQSAPLPQRIVSTSLASDEILLHILPESDWSRIAAISPLATNPEYSHLDTSKMAKLRVYDNAIESFIATKPDLVIMASFNQPAVIDHVEKNKIRHILLNQFDSIADIKGNIIRIATAVGQRQRGRQLVTELTNAVEAIRKRSPERKPRILSLDQGFVTMGQKTLFDDLVKNVGGENLAAAWGIQRWSKISIEKVLTDAPDIIVLGAVTKNTDQEFSWLQQSALRNLRTPDLRQRLCLVPANSLLSTSQFVTSALKIMSDCVVKWQK